MAYTMFSIVYIASAARINGLPSEGFTRIQEKTRRRKKKRKMKDKGLVIATQNGLARVEVQCLIESCGSCSAKSLCSGKAKDKGHLDVQNPCRHELSLSSHS